MGVPEGESAGPPGGCSSRRAAAPALLVAEPGGGWRLSVEPAAEPLGGVPRAAAVHRSVPDGLRPVAARGAGRGRRLRLQDGSATWAECLGVRPWQKVACSANGMRLVVGSYSSPQLRTSRRGRHLGPRCIAPLPAPPQLPALCPACCCAGSGAAPRAPCTMQDVLHPQHSSRCHRIEPLPPPSPIHPHPHVSASMLA